MVFGDADKLFDDRCKTNFDLILRRSASPFKFRDLLFADDTQLFEIDPVLLETYAECIISIASNYNMIQNWDKVQAIIFTNAEVTAEPTMSIPKIR